jgi:Domain of unknown function (DUF1836).
MKKDNSQQLKELLNKLSNLDYIKTEDIPNIALYMDQVTTFMDSRLENSKRYPEDKILTKTMINNYAKNQLLPSPDKKKYSKDHLILLIMIYYLKNILSINDIKRLITPLTERFFTNTSSELNLSEIYARLFELENDSSKQLTKDIINHYKKSFEPFSDIKNDKDREYLHQLSLISILSFDVYIKKQIIESMIDDMTPNKNDKK